MFVETILKNEKCENVMLVSHNNIW
jgi:hypothetical protein